MSGPTPDHERELAELVERFESERLEVRDQRALDELRTRYLGRKQGELTLAMRALKELPPGERPAAGQRMNAVKARIESALAGLAEALSSRQAAGEDVSLPGRRPARGHAHPLRLAWAELESIFRDMGYEIVHGREVDDDFHNFEALNQPPGHPARDMQDTFYVTPDVVLRSHTSNVQVHVMQTRRPPIRVVAPGRVFRRDTPDLTHSPVFHQMEGLVVDEGIHFGHLKGTLEHFAKRLFGSETRIRLRPSFFPFTEPSAELDISCIRCQGSGCGLCKHSGWIELLGCGMVDPNVFGAVGIDAERYTGFAFGLGIERAAMFKYGIENIRLLYDNDLRFLSRFVGAP